ncbi:MAG: molecular chaperone DnaK, partial [Dehalococcoidales bacterium]|nr:molecular chaperone DnaK [Dehalococcoidales bacterium]
VRSAMQGTDMNIIKQATQDLSDALQKIGQAVYQAQPQQPPPPPPPGGQEPPPPGGEPPKGGEGGTVEGEFREV